MLRGNPIPERGDGRRKAGLHTMGAKGEGPNSYQWRTNSGDNR